MDAIKEGHHMVALILKRKGALLSLQNMDDGSSAEQLCNAAAVGDVRRLRLLKDAGVSLNQVRARSHSFWMCIQGSAECQKP